MGADTSVVRKKHERNPMTQEQERRQENTKPWKKGEGKSIGQKRAEYSGI